MACWGNSKQPNILIHGIEVPHEEKKRADRKIFKEIIVEKLLNLFKIHTRSSMKANSSTSQNIWRKVDSHIMIINIL